MVLFQTNPTYLAKLIFQMPQNKSTKFMDSVIFTLYNYASNQREEYLLLRLFKTALQEEIKYGRGGRGLTSPEVPIVVWTQTVGQGVGEALPSLETPIVQTQTNLVLDL